MKGDIEIIVYTWNFTYIVNNQYLLWIWYWLKWFEIDWELIENKQKVNFPKFVKKLKRQYNLDLILIPLNRIKKVTYEVYFGRKDEAHDDIKNLTKEFDNKVCKPIIQPSTLFCLLKEKTIINIRIQDKLNVSEDWNKINLQDKFEEELKNCISISPSIKYMKIVLFEITSENVNSFLQLLKGWIRLNKLVFKVRESDKRISQDIIDTIAKYNQSLSLIDVSINTEGAEFLHFAQISCDRNIIIRSQDDK